MINQLLCYQVLDLDMASPILSVLTLQQNHCRTVLKEEMLLLDQTRGGCDVSKTCVSFKKSMHNMKVLIGLVTLHSCPDHGPWSNNRMIKNLCSKQMNYSDYVQ